MDEENDYEVHKAAREGDIKLLEDLIAAGHSVNTCTYDLSTPLHEACLLGHTHCVSILLEAGGNVDARNVDGSTPLCDAASKGSIGCVAVLLRNGASVNPALNYTTPLHEAVLRDRTEVAEVLIQHGACLNANDLHYGTPLHVSAYFDHVNSARILLQYGANVNAVRTHLTPLHLAARKNSPAMVELLLEAGGDIYARTSLGYMAKRYSSPKGPSRELLLNCERQVFTLMHWCRIAARQSLGSRQVPKQELPKLLDDYLKFKC